MVEPIPEGGLDLGIPTRGSKEGYLGLYFISRQQLGNIIGNLQGVTDQRLEIFTRFMIYPSRTGRRGKSCSKN